MHEIIKSYIKTTSKDQAIKQLKELLQECNSGILNRSEYAEEISLLCRHITSFKRKEFTL